MTTYWIKIELLSDTLFGRGDGLAGVVDDEVQHDPYGLPFLSGKTLKGILGAMCAEILHALALADRQSTWDESARRLFGRPGSTLDDAALLHVGHARLPEDLRQAVIDDIDSGPLTRQMVLESLTGLRRQTAMDAVTGAPKQETLRTIRVIQRDLPFSARLQFVREPDQNDLALLAACIKAFKRVGSNRNRGLGRIKAELYAADPFEAGALPVTDAYFQHFSGEVTTG